MQNMSAFLVNGPYDLCTFQNIEVNRIRTCELQPIYHKDYFEVTKLHCPDFEHRAAFVFANYSNNAYACSFNLKSVSLEDSGKWACQVVLSG